MKPESDTIFTQLHISLQKIILSGWTMTSIQYIGKHWDYRFFFSFEKCFFFKYLLEILQVFNVHRNIETADFSFFPSFFEYLLEICVSGHMARFPLQGHQATIWGKQIPYPLKKTLRYLISQSAWDGDSAHWPLVLR